MNKQIIIVICLVFLLSFSAFVNANSLLEVEQITQADDIKNIFYLSKYQNSEILYKVNANYNYPANNVFKYPKLKYDLFIYDSVTNPNISIKLTTTEDIITSNVNDRVFALDIKTFDFKDSIIKARIKIELYDEYDNLVDSTNKYLTIVANNSDYYYPNTKTHILPKLNGFKLSRDVSLLFDDIESDVINIKLYTDINFGYDVNCTSEKDFIDTEINYNFDNTFDLNIFIDHEYDVSNTNGKVFVNCKAFNAYEIVYLTPIIIKYDFSEEYTSSDNSDVDNDTIEDTNTSKSTAFFNISQSNYIHYWKIFLGIIIVVIIIFVLFKK